MAEGGPLHSETVATVQVTYTSNTPIHVYLLYLHKSVSHLVFLTFI